MEKVFTPEQTAELLHVATKTIKDWLRSGELPGIKVGRQWRVTESDLQKYIDLRKGQSVHDKAES